MNLKLKHSIYLMILFCTIIPIGIWIAFSVYDSQKRTENIIRENIEAIGGSQVMTIENFCEERKENMETISRIALVKNAILNYPVNGHSEELNDFLAENEKQKTYIASVSVVDVNFNNVGSSQWYATDELSVFQYSSERYHSGEFIMGDVYERETDAGVKRLIPAVIGVFDGDKLIGYLIQEIECAYFNRLRLQTDFLEDGTLYLIDGAGEYITAGSALETESRYDHVTTEEERKSYQEAWNAFDHENNVTGIIDYEIKGQAYMTYFCKVKNTDWNILITENLNAQWKADQSGYVLIMLEGIAVMIILLGVQFVITQKLVTPFNQIVSTLRCVREQRDYSLRTGVDRTDEVGVIAKGIDGLLRFAEQAEKEREHKEFLSESMLANMPSGYHRCLPDVEKGFPFLQLGSHIEEILGWTAEEIQNDLGNCYKNLIWPEDLEIALTYAGMVSRVGSGNAYDTSVYRMKHKDGGYRWITDATMFVDLGEESFFQGVIADITPYVEGMEEAKRQAEASNHAKTDFLSQMSHDIRTPMNAIIGFTNLANQSDELKVIKEEYLPKIETASNHLLMIINDVLEMNSIEKGKIVFNRDMCNIENIVQGFLTVMQLQAEVKKLKLITDIRITDSWVYCDESRFHRVFMNLVSNAIKFTPDGGTVTIFMEQQGKAKDGYASYIFKITDTGIGMTPEFAPKVFEPFERERTSTVSRMEGTGLGMAIVKSIVDAAGGSISVDSAPNRGTTFTIQLQLALAEPDRIVSMEENQKEKPKKEFSVEELQKYFTGKRVLLAEDNEFNRVIAETVLENAGFLVESAEDGNIAVQMVENAPSETYYDVILMDIQMPTMNGYEATAVIRAMKDERSKVKIIAATANAFESDRQAAKDAGMDGHVSKPIDVTVLYQTLLDVCQNSDV